MLRMFARYATDTTNIVPLDRLEGDVARGDLPPFVAIEPQMHAHPEDDDHPDADMLRGQLFVKRVYDALRSNPAVWAKTLLIITYDEHGGLYDHVVPPIADVLRTPGGGPLTSVNTGTSVITRKSSSSRNRAAGGSSGGNGRGCGRACRSRSRSRRADCRSSRWRRCSCRFLMASACRPLSSRHGPQPARGRPWCSTIARF